MRVMILCNTACSASSVGAGTSTNSGLARRAELLGAQVQPLRERGVAVVAQALRIGDGDEEQIQRRGARLAAIDEVPPHEGVINPAELRGHLAQPLGRSTRLMVFMAAPVDDVVAQLYKAPGGGRHVIL